MAIDYGRKPTAGENIGGLYILWSPTSAQPPTVVFDSRPAAVKAAYRMAGKFPNQEFTVCKIVGSAKTGNVNYESYED